MSNTIKNRLVTGSVQAALLSLAVGVTPLYAAHPCVAKNPCGATKHW
jgi:hypothetical protein